MYRVRKIGIFNILDQFKINNILFDCGKDMATKYDLHHWDNSYFKNFVIILLCEIKNNVYLIEDDLTPVATFQTKFTDDSIHFEKLACSPKHAGKGIGTFCINYIEEIAKKTNCKKVCMEVYSPSQHALDFYLHRGYKTCGKMKTRKYEEVKMEKLLK